MTQHCPKWSGSEKKIARRAFDAALGSALAEIMAEFKEKAAVAATPAEMWDTEDYLRRRRREIDDIFDYRYSQLPLVFAALICKGYLAEVDLAGISAEKLEIIRRVRAQLRRD